MQAKLTKRTVESIAADEYDQLVWDTELRRFGLKITPKGRRIYVLQYRFSGRLRRYTIGEHGSPWTPDLARREASRLLGQVAAGKDPAQFKTSARRAPTLKEFSERYSDEHASAKKKPKSAKEDRRLLEKNLLPVLGAQKVRNITRADISKFHLGMKDTPYLANRALALLSKMFNLAEAWGVRPDATNPCRHVEKFKEKKRERYLSSVELARLGEALTEAEADNTLSPSAVLAIRLLLLTGSRVLEILTARWDSLIPSTGFLRLPDSKTGAKAIPLGAAALELLASATRLENNPYIVPGDKPGAHLVGLQKAWERLRKKIGLDEVRLNDLRHSYASVAVSGGDSLPVIGAILGHKQSATTQRYAHLSNDPVRDAANRISKSIDNTMRSGTDNVVPLRRPQPRSQKMKSEGGSGG